MAYISHFCTRKHSPNRPSHPISHFTENSDSSIVRPNRNTYGAANIALATLLIALGGSALLLPRQAGAFWPFPAITQAADADSNGPVLHDSSIELLKAAINSDPNPNKGGSELTLTEGSALIANAGPEGTIADIQHIPVNNSISTYTVVEGDTLSSIAKDNSISVNTILWANNLAKGATVKPGQKLIILPVTGIEHVVGKGETAQSLAKKYGGEVRDIEAYNGLDAGESLTAGITIIIPDGELPAPAAPTKKTVAKAKAPAAAKKVSTPSIGGFSNPLPAGVCTQGIHGNNGVDIGAHAGTPIYAAASGSVIIALDNGGWNGGFGNYVVINHANGSQTLYAHMSSTAISAGSSVEKGQLIGYVGATGKATGNHLHFEVHKGGTNPFCH